MNLTKKKNVRLFLSQMFTYFELSLRISKQTHIYISRPTIIDKRKECKDGIIQSNKHVYCSSVGSPICEAG